MLQNIFFRFIFLIAVWLFPFGSSGQNATQLFFEQPYALQRADISAVTYIFKDSRHIMWFGTNNGLYRYDGVNLRYFSHKNGDTASLPNNRVLGIAEGNDGQLWVSLLTGIAKIDLNTLQCKTYSAIDKKNGVGNYTNKICIDADGNVWVGNNVGIFLFDKKKQVFTNVWNDKIPGYALSGYITSLISANKHLLIASAFHDVILFNKDDNSFKRIPIFFSQPPKDSTLTSVFLDSKQKLWIGTWGGGIYTYDITKNRLSHITSLLPGKNIPYYYVTSFYETKFYSQHFMWVATSMGLIQCSIDSNSNIQDFAFISHDKNSNSSIIPGKIEGLYLDDNMALWCGGDNGVVKCFPFQNSFRVFASLKGLIRDIELVKIKNDNCYFINSWNSQEGKGFLVEDNNGNDSYKTFDPRFTDEDDKRNISGIAEDKRNRLWISSMAGVSVLDEKFDLIKQWNKNTVGENNLTYHRTDGVAIVNDTAWVICYHRGVDLFDMRFKKLRHYAGGDGNGLEDNYIFSFFRDSKGNLWLCGDNKLYKYLPGAGKFKSFGLSAEQNACRPRDIAEDKNGNLIIASAVGLIQFDPKTEKYTYIHSSLLEKEQNVSAIAIDKHEGIWFLTDKHMVHYIPGESRFILFGKEDGLDVSKGLNALRTFNGTEFYLCQDEQVVKFNCDSLNQSCTPPYLVVNMQANDSSVYLSNNAGDLFLPYDKNKLQFEFTGVSYIKADQNQYYYQLAGIDNQWNTTYKNTISYTNLSPGAYTFKVKTVNYAGLWSEEKEIHFIITPPYWQTWWFRLIVSVGALSILFYIIRYVSQRNLKEKILHLEKETAVEKERTRIAQDMHDDLGSGLTKIAIMSEVVKQQIGQPEKASEQLELISDSSRTLVDNLQDIVWMLNSKHDKLDSLAFYIREYATKYFELSDISVSFDYPTNIEPVKVSDEQRRNLFMAIKESLNNIAKHADASNVNIAFTSQQRNIEFVVTDNGKGFNPEETGKFSNGVKNMQNRMQQVKGECAIVSVPDKGTTITLVLPI